MRPSDARWSNPRVLAILGVIFLFGAAFGSAVTREYLHSRMPSHELQTMEVARHVGLISLQKELHLTPDQMKAVQKELDDYAKYYQNIKEQYEDVADQGKRRFLAVLTDEQRRRFDQICKQATR